MKKHLLFLAVIVAALCLLLPATAIATEGESVYEAQIGEEMYESLVNAIENADGQTVTLLKDVDLESSFIKVTNSVILDLAGHRISSAYSGSYATIYTSPSGNLTIMDTSSTGTGAIFNSAGTAVGVFGNLTINSGTFTGNYAVYVWNTAINNQPATATLTGGTFKTIEGGYYSVLNSGKLTVSGSAKTQKYLSSTGDLTVSGGSVDILYLPVIDYSPVSGSTTTIENAAVIDSFMIYTDANEINITGGRVTTNLSIKGTLDVVDLTVSGGVFPVNPSAYLAENKIATLQNGLFYVVDKPEDAPDVSVDIKAEDTVKEDIQIDTNAGIATEDIENVQQAVADAVNKEDTKQDLQNAANNLQHDSSVVGSADEAHNALQEQDSANYNPETEVEVQVKPYLDITVKEYNTSNNTVKLDIKALYDVVAVQKGNGNEVTASATLKEAQPMTNVTTAITITIPLPTGFANDGDTVYIYHTKSDGTLYIHEATVSVAGGATTATFVNDQGFSSFEVKKTSASLQTLDYTNLNLGNNLDINFYIAMSKLPANTENLVAKFIRTYADGSTAQTEVPFSSWVVDGSYYRFTYAGIAAKEMCDNVTVQIFDGNTAVSVAFTESIQKYAQRLFDWDGAEAKDFKMMISLLDYGTTAQEYLNYNTINLANSIVTQAHKNKAEQAV